MRVLLLDTEGAAGANKGARRCPRVVSAQGAQGGVVGGDETPGGSLGDREPFLIEGSEGSLEGIFSPGFRVPFVMRDLKESASWIQMGRVSSIRIDVSLLSLCINTLIQ